MTKRQAASCQQIDNLAALPTAADRSWIQFNSGAIAARWKAKVALPLRAATLKQQAMITQSSGKAASGKLVWNQYYSTFLVSGRDLACQQEVSLALTKAPPIHYYNVVDSAFSNYAG